MTAAAISLEVFISTNVSSLRKGTEFPLFTFMCVGKRRIPVADRG
jgi:hypothetical protein